MGKDIEKATVEELEAELADRKGGVKAAEAKVESADSADAPARKVEAIAGKIEAEEPAVSTEEATARAKDEVPEKDPFNTVKGYEREVDVTTGKEIVEPKDEAKAAGTAKDKAAARKEA